MWKNTATARQATNDNMAYAHCMLDNYEIMWKNTAQPDRPQMAIWRMRIACCVTMR